MLSVAKFKAEIIKDDGGNGQAVWKVLHFSDGLFGKNEHNIDLSAFKRLVIIRRFKPIKAIHII